MIKLKGIEIFEVFVCMTSYDINISVSNQSLKYVTMSEVVVVVTCCN